MVSTMSKLVPQKQSTLCWRWGTSTEKSRLPWTQSYLLSLQVISTNAHLVPAPTSQACIPKWKQFLFFSAAQPTSHHTELHLSTCVLHIFCSHRFLPWSLNSTLKKDFQILKRRFFPSELLKWLSAIPSKIILYP